MKDATVKIFVAGHLGMVGAAIVRELKKSNNKLIVQSRKDLDLLDQRAVSRFMSREIPDQIYIAAARVGGIYANSKFPAEFIYENLTIQNNLIESAYRAGIKKILFLGSSCIYPKLAPQPIDESKLLTGLLEPTNEPYAIAKIAGIKMCEAYNSQYSDGDIDYRAVMPTNLYGPGDNYDLKNSHVIPGLMRRIHEAKLNGDKEVIVWGSGRPLREFMFVDDLAKSCIYIMNLKKEILNSLNVRSHINVGSGEEISIGDLAHMLTDVIGYSGHIVFDETKPDGTPRKLLDSTLLKKLGWTSSTKIKHGLEVTYRDFVINYEQIKRS